MLYRMNLSSRGAYSTACGVLTFARAVLRHLQFDRQGGSLQLPWHFGVPCLHQRTLHKQHQHSLIAACTLCLFFDQASHRLVPRLLPRH